MRTSMTPWMVVALVPVAGGVLGAENVPEPASFEPVRAWIDAPLPGTVIAPPNPCRLVVHGSSEAGVASFELSIDDAAPIVVPSPDPGVSLVTATFDCDVSGAGWHDIELRAIANDGTASDEASTSVVVPGVERPPMPEIDSVETTTTIPQSTTTVLQSTTTVAPAPATTTVPAATTTAAPATTTTAAPIPTSTTTVVPPGDTQPPTVSIAHTPPDLSLPEFTFTTFTATAADDVSVTRIEILIRGDLGRASVVRTCDGVDICEYTNGYPPGNIHYSARAFDAAGNQALAPETSIEYFVVVR